MDRLIRTPASRRFVALSRTTQPGTGRDRERRTRWEARAEGLNGRLASPEQVELAIRSYRQSVAAEPELVEARWKLLRSLHYLVEFTNASEQRKESAVTEAVAVASADIEGLGESAHDLRNRSSFYFWSAIAWGARGQRVGLLTIVREGVATKIHDYAKVAVALDSDIERGGGYRLLSRLHAELPRVPFVSGWVDRGQAIPLARKAFGIDPSDPGNRLILALALTEQAPDRRSEAVALLESVAKATPRPSLLAEDLAIREQARDQLLAIR